MRVVLEQAGGSLVGVGADHPEDGQRIHSIGNSARILARPRLGVDGRLDPAVVLFMDRLAGVGAVFPLDLGGDRDAGADLAGQSLFFSRWEKVAAKRSDEGRASKSA